MSDISFEFIRHPDFKSSLVSDYREMILSQQNACWKAVHILAGSIIEALLADELSFLHPNDQKIFSMLFEKLIERCESEGLLSLRAVQLTTVVRGYRNLVHPGRIVRLQETVDEDGANTAVSLTRMVVREVAVRRMRTFGPTAEQVVEKVKIDSQNHTAHLRLVGSLHNTERLRLVTEVIPLALKTLDVYEGDQDIAVAMGKIMEAAYYDMSPEERPKMCGTYARLIETGSSHEIDTFERFLFDSSWLSSATSEDKQLVVDHLVEKFMLCPDTHIRLIEDLGKYTDPNQFYELIRVAVSAAERGDVAKEVRAACRKYVLDNCAWVEREKIESMELMLSDLHDHFCSQGHQSRAEFVRSIKVREAYDPFADE